MLTHDQMYNKVGAPQFLKLVLEFNQLRPQWNLDDAVFTLKAKHEGLISLRKLFVAHVAEDPTEVSFALAVFDDVAYWTRVREYADFKPYVEKWRAEADIIRKSKAFKSILSEVKEGGRSSFSAAKYLIEEPWKGRAKTTKENIKKTTEKAFDLVRDDLTRLKEEGFIQ